MRRRSRSLARSLALDLEQTSGIHSHSLTSLYLSIKINETSPGDPPRGPARRRLLRRLGRALLVVRLRARGRAPQGGPVELHRGGSAHRRFPAAQDGARICGQVGGVRRGAARDDRGARHPADQDDGAAAGAADARRRAAGVERVDPFPRGPGRGGVEHDPWGAAAAAGRRRRSGGEQQRAERERRRRQLFRWVVWRRRRQRGGRFFLECSHFDSGWRPDVGPFRSAADARGTAGRGLGGERRRQRRRGVV